MIYSNIKHYQKLLVVLTVRILVACVIVSILHLMQTLGPETLHLEQEAAVHHAVGAAQLPVHAHLAPVQVLHALETRGHKLQWETARDTSCQRDMCANAWQYLSYAYACTRMHQLALGHTRIRMKTVPVGTHAHTQGNSYQEDMRTHV